MPPLDALADATLEPGCGILKDVICWNALFIPWATDRESSSTLFLIYREFMLFVKKTIKKLKDVTIMVTVSIDDENNKKWKVI